MVRQVPLAALVAVDFVLYTHPSFLACPVRQPRHHTGEGTASYPVPDTLLRLLVHPGGVLPIFAAGRKLETHWHEDSFLVLNASNQDGTWAVYGSMESNVFRVDIAHDGRHQVDIDSRGEVPIGFSVHQSGRLACI